MFALGVSLVASDLPLLHWARLGWFEARVAAVAAAVFALAVAMAFVGAVLSYDAMRTPSAAVVIASVSLALSAALLLAPSPPGMREVHARAAGPRVDHAHFDALLKRVVDGEGLVDYRLLADDPKQLDAYLRRLASAPLAELARDERLALLLNAYNAFTLKLIAERYPLRSIRDVPADERWSAVRWNLGGRLFSLDQVEHEVLRREFVEPRIHFAVSCASLGCPPLRREAYVASRLEAQLDDQARRVHASPRWLELLPDGRVRLTRLYLWFAPDFEQVAGSAVAYAARHSPALEEELEDGARPRVEWLPYDWALNAAPDPSAR